MPWPSSDAPPASLAEKRKRAEHPAYAANEVAMAAFNLAAKGLMDPNAAELIFRLAAIVSQIAVENETPDNRRRRLHVVKSGDC